MPLPGTDGATIELLKFFSRQAAKRREILVVDPDPAVIERYRVILDVEVSRDACLGPGRQCPKLQSLSTSPGNCDPATSVSVQDPGIRIQKLVGGTGHYLNSKADLTGGVLELIRTYGHGGDHAPRG